MKNVLGEVPQVINISKQCINEGNKNYIQDRFISKSRNDSLSLNIYINLIDHQYALWNM